MTKSTKNIVKKRSKVIFLGIIIASLFLPFILPVKNVAAQQANAYTTCEVTTYKNPVIKVNKSTVANDEAFNIYTSFDLVPNEAQNCKNSDLKKDEYRFTYYMTPRIASTGGGVFDLRWCPTVTNSTPQITFKAFLASDGSKFQNKTTEATLAKFFKSNTIGAIDQNCLYVYFHKTNQSSTSLFNYAYPNYVKQQSGTHNETDTSIPADAGKEFTTPWGQATVNSTEEISYKDLLISIKPSNGVGLRSKYRVSLADTEMKFGVTPGLDPVHVEWSQKSIELGQYFTLPEKDDGYGWTFKPYYIGSQVFFNYAGVLKEERQIACQPTWTGTDCKGVVFREADGSNKGAGSAGKTIPENFDPILKAAAWKEKLTSTKPTTDGKALGSVDFVAVPSISGKGGNFTGGGAFDLVRSSEVIVVAAAGGLQKFTVEVFSKDEDIIAACKADSELSEEDKKQCDKIEFAKFGFAKHIEQTTSSNEKEDGALGSDLFTFLRKVISYLVLLITSVLYWIFAIILVPMLNALLKIRPYQDQFVNFIYPGWVIVRNITNIGFILALLWMGMRTLFQVEDSGKTRGFILWLVLMALLVNFSLVIAQGIVGIADTVQSQFLPAESKVIEALGQKLMVDPIKFFRGQNSDSDITKDNNFTVEASASDITKPIVLLILAIAAFFSFIALIAFILVRLVVLWVLYMLSPVAYVAQILPETRTYTKQWWDHFLKNAFTVPVLAFFLNIAALMATTFASRTGVSVDAGRDPNYLFGNVAGDFAEYAITIISHFIVLAFLFIGMKFAMSSGAFGAKEIVNGAKKGFDFVTKTVPQAAGRGAVNLGKSLAKEQYERRIAGGMLDPKAWKQSWKDRVATQTKVKKAERLSKNANRLSPGNILPPEGSLKDRAGVVGKYLWAKASGRDPHAQLATAQSLKDRASILTDTQRTDLEDDKRDNLRDKANAEGELGMLNSGQILESRATEYENELQKRIDDIDARKVDLAKKKRKVAPGGAEDKAIDAEILSLDEDKTQLNNALTEFSAAKGRSSVPGVIDLTGVNMDQISVVLDPDALRTELTTAIDKAEKNDKSYQTKLDEDRERKAKYGVATIDDDEKRDLEARAAALEKDASQRYMPASYTALQARRDMQGEYAKKVEALDDIDELVEAFGGAMKKNNTAFATEIAKKLAKLGGMDELLHKNGYSNNLSDFQKFIDKSFAKLAPQVRLQVGAEISYVAKNNGNASLGNSTKYSYNAKTGENVINWASHEESAKKLDAKYKGMEASALAKAEKTDISEEKGGVWHLRNGFVANLNRMNPDSLKSYLRNIAPSKIEHMKKAKGWDSINSQVRFKLLGKL